MSGKGRVIVIDDEVNAAAALETLLREDGYEVARKLRASESLKAIKLIALTGYGQADDARRAHEAGFDLHVVKPIDPERLADAVSTVVGGVLSAPPRTLA